MQVVAAACGAAHAAQCKAPVGVGIDELVRHRGHIGQHTQPTKRVYAFIGLEHIGRRAGAAHAVKAIAARDEVAFDRVLPPVLFVAHHGGGAVKPVDRYVFGVIHGGQPLGRTCLHQVAGDFGLAVHRHAAAASELMQVDAVALALEQQLDAVVWQAFGMRACTHASLVQQVHADLLQNPRADAAEHVVGAALLNDDGVDARSVEQLTEQQTGGAFTNDGNLGTHEEPRKGSGSSRKGCGGA